MALARKAQVLDEFRPQQRWMEGLDRKPANDDDVDLNDHSRRIINGTRPPKSGGERRDVAPPSIRSRHHSNGVPTMISRTTPPRNGGYNSKWFKMIKMRGHCRSQCKTASRDARLSPFYRSEFRFRHGLSSAALHSPALISDQLTWPTYNKNTSSCSPLVTAFRFEILARVRPRLSECEPSLGLCNRA